jgi:hypothetical protein
LRGTLGANRVRLFEWKPRPPGSSTPEQRLPLTAVPP